MLRLLLPPLVATVLFLTLTPTIASAHAELAGSDPGIDGVLEQSPPAVTLWFTERPEPSFSEIQVLDASARRVDRGTPRPDPADPLALRAMVGNLTPGTYTVIWRALSTVDGHVTRGAFAFAVGRDQIISSPGLGAQDSGPTARPAEVLARVLSYLGFAGAAGAFPFAWWVLLPALAASGPPRSGEALIRRVGLLALAGVGIGLVGALGLLLTQASAAFDVSLTEALGQPALNIALGTRSGGLVAFRTLLLGALGVVALLMMRGVAGRPILGAGAAVGALLLLAHALGSHSAAAPGATGGAIAVQWTHLAALSTWVGGLAHLLLVLGTLARASTGGSATILAGRIVPRFSWLGGACIAVLVASGLYQAWLLVGSPGALPSTAYGQTLLVKFALIAPLLGLAAVNLLVLRPRLQRAAARPEAPAPILRVLRMSVAGEIAVVAGVFIASGVLTNLQPAREAAIVQGTTAQATADDLRATLRVQPGAAGSNRFQLTLTDRQGRPVEGVERVALRFTMRAVDLGESELPAGPAVRGQAGALVPPPGVSPESGATHYVAQGGVLVVPGPWRIEALVRRPGREDVRPSFDVTIAQPLPPGPLAFAAQPAEGNLVFGVELAAAGIGLVTAAVWLRRRPRARLLLPAAVASLLAGTIIGTSSLAALSATVRNPVPPTERSIARGGGIYFERCALCHGESGRGDGPAAIGLNPRPADLRVHLAAGHTDAQLFDWVTNGFAGSAMPAFRDELSEEDRWHVLNYIRTGFGPGVPSAR